MIPTPDYDLGTARGTIELDASSLGRASAAFASLGAGLVGFGAVAVGAFAYTVREAANFERQISAVGAVSNATATEMDLLRARALELGGSTVYSATEIARAMEQLAKAGITIPEILGGATEATVTLAAAAGDELAGGVDSAAEVIANAMKTFEAGAEDMNHFADVLVGAAASSTTSVDDMATSMRYAGPIAHEMGLSIDDLSTVLAIFGDRGIKGSTAGTTLRGVLISLQGASGPARDALEDLGIITEDGTNRFFDMHGALKPMPEIMQILQESFAGLSEEERIAAANAIFQRRAMNGALILADQGAAGFNRYAAAIAAIDAENVAARKLDNLSGDMTILKNTINALVIQVGLQFQDMLRGWVQGLTGVIDWIRNLDPELLKMIVQVTAVAGAIALVLGSISLFIAIGIRMYRTVRDLIVAGRAIVGVIRLLTTTLLASPWFWVIAALVALGYALWQLYQRNEAFREAVQRLFGWLESNVLPIIQQIIAGFQAFWSALMGQGGEADGIVGIFQTIGEAVRTFAQQLSANLVPAIMAVGRFLRDEVVPAVSAVIDAFRWLIAEGVERLVSAFQWLEENVFPIFTALADLVVAAIERIIAILGFFAPYFQLTWDAVKVVLDVFLAGIGFFVDAVVTIWRLFGDNLFGVMQAVWNLIRGLITGALQVIQGIIQAVTGLISGDWSRVWEGIKNIFGGIWETMKTLLSAALDFFKLTIETTVDAIHALWEIGWNLIKTTFTTIWDTIKAILGAALDFVLGLIRNFLDLTHGIWSTAWNTITGVLQAAWEAMKSAVSTAMSAIVTFFQGLPGQILAALGDVLSLLVQKGRDTIQGMINGLTETIVNLLSLIGGLPGEILSALGDMGQLLYNAGRQIIDGLINGIQSMLGSLGDVVGGIGGFISGLKGPPSYDKVMLIPHGKLIMQGLIHGIQSQMGALETVMKSVAPSIQAQVTAGGTVEAAGLVTAGSTTMTIENVTIPAKDLQEMRDVKDFFDRVRQTARQGVS